ncbi:MAG TPA: hypothetical protein VGK85_10780, partial [Myxococcaceae bacterium]
ARVEAVQGLLGGLHAIGHELPAPVQPARSPWLRRAAVTLAALAAVAVAIVWGAARERRLEHALEVERAAADASRHQAAELATQLSAAQSARAPERPVPTLPSGRVPVLSLIATRGTQLPTLAVPPSGTPVVLLVERESPPRFGRYRVTLQGPGGDRVLQAELAPSSRDVVAVGVDPALLEPGLHVLTVEGLPGRGAPAPVGRHRFQVVSTR